MRLVGSPRWSCVLPTLAASFASILCALAAVSAPAAAAGDTATITFRKIFKSSYPEFVEIKVSETGASTYDIRQMDEEASPQSFEVSRQLAQKIFQLAGELHRFDGIDLDVHRRIANLGQKTFRYERGSESHEVVFNYTLDANANQLLELFEGLGREQIDLSDLERTMRYDRLGVNDVMERLEADYTAKLIPEPQRLLPALDQLAAGDKFLDMARQRARSLAARIRSTH